MPSPKLAFIFDLDGTIVDSTAHYRETWAEFIREFGVEDDPDLYVRRATRENLRLLLGQGADPHELERYAARHAQAGNSKMRASGIRPHDGVVELIKGLHVYGVHLALATAAEKSNAEWTLQELGIRELFDTLVVDQDVALGKPAPDVYLEALNRLDTAPDHCAVMEDSATGVQAAKAAGLRVIAVLTTHSRRELTQAGADRIIDRATDIGAQEIIDFITAAPL